MERNRESERDKESERKKALKWLVAAILKFQIAYACPSLVIRLSRSTSFQTQVSTYAERGVHAYSFAI